MAKRDRRKAQPPQPEPPNQPEPQHTPQSTPYVDAFDVLPVAQPVFAQPSQVTDTQYNNPHHDDAPDDEPPPGSPPAELSAPVLMPRRSPRLRRLHTRRPA
jgi:hypothetical protein